jgi:hypothetical protein
MNRSDGQLIEVVEQVPARVRPKLTAMEEPEEWNH